MGDPSVVAETSVLVDHARFRIDNFDIVSASGLVIQARGNVGYVKRVFSHAVEAGNIANTMKKSLAGNDTLDTICHALFTLATTKATSD